MDGIVSLFKESLENWQFVETPYYEHGINVEEEFDHHNSDSSLEFFSANDPTATTPINVRDDADYFIDGVMHIAIVGYVYDSQSPTTSFPIIAGDVVASSGELYYKTFKIIKHKHAIVLTHPKELTIKEEVYKKLKGCIAKWTSAEFELLEYPCDKSSGESNNSANLSTKSRFSQARHEVLNYMRKEEKRLLDWILQNNKNNYRVFIDGEFQSSDNKYASSRVISICKQLSLQSLESKFNLRASDITNLEGGAASQAYKWAFNDENEYMSKWYTWFMRLRQHALPDQDRTMSDIIQCTVVSESSPDNDLIEEWKQRLLKLAYPTCYGLDKRRWRTHIYPIYLTELYGKQQQLNIELFNKIIYG